MNVCYGLMTGIGTIDRLKKKATSTMEDSDEEQIPLKDVFGVGPYYLWMVPTDPIFEDYDRVMGYSTPQRLLREQMQLQMHGNGNSNQHHPGGGSSSGMGPGSGGAPMGTYYTDTTSMLAG